MHELEEIKHIRKKFGMTQSELAGRAGVSQSLIAKIESKMIDPTYSNARKIFNALDTLKSKKDIKAEQIMVRKIISANADTKVQDAIKLMKKHNISQMPVLKGRNPVGLISESILLEAIISNKNPDTLVSDVMKEVPPVISKESSQEVVSSLLKHYPLVLVSEKGILQGLITRSDLLARVYR